MEVKVAKTAGFCFGVKRAVETVYEQVEKEKDKQIYTYGPIIHNDEVVKDMQKRGVKVIRTEEELENLERYEQVEKEKDKQIYTYGPIIHNDEVVKDMQKRGVKVIRTEEELENLESGVVIIRSHGVPKRIYDKLAEKNITCVDATCPFVKKIHNIVKRESEAGSQIVIIGNAEHPEVEGIKGWSTSPVTVIQTMDDVNNFEPDKSKKVCIVSQTTFNYKKFEELVEIISKKRYDISVLNTICNATTERPDKSKKVCIVSQTTFNYKKFEELVEIISKKRYDISVLNTICNATTERQTEARSIAEGVDAMIVIGDKHSSNTQKLFEICDKVCNNTYYIQTLDDLDLNQLGSAKTVGITAGASTPNNIIEEVQNNVRINF